MQLKQIDETNFVVRFSYSEFPALVRAIKVLHAHYLENHKEIEEIQKINDTLLEDGIT